MPLRAAAVAAAVLFAPLPALAAAPSPAPSSPAPATAANCPPGIGIGLLEVPKSPERDPRARSYIIDHVAPGARFSRKVRVCNGTAASLAVRLYAAAAAVQGGQFQLDVTPADNDVSRSIRVAPPTLTIANGAAAEVEATFSVPRDARSGEQYAVIYAQAQGRRADGVQTRSRVGVRVYLDIGKGGEKPSDFRIDSLQASRGADGAPLVTAQVTNTGARALDLVGELALTDGPGSLSAGPFPATKGTTVGVGETDQVRVPLPREIRGGPWTAALTLRSGLLERRAEATITFPDSAGSAAPPARARQVSIAAEHRIVVPLAVGLVGLLLLLLLVLAYLTSRRRARDRGRALVD